MPYESTGTNHNNLRNQAENYELGTTMYGKIERRNDVDAYKVFLRPGTIHYEFTVPANMNYRFKVYREGNYDDDTFICRDENPCAQTRDGVETINIGEADFYYIAISFHNENDVFDTENYYSFRLYYTSLNVLNFNKSYINNRNEVRSDGCALCCAADLSSFYADSTITFDDLMDDGVFIAGRSECCFENSSYFTRTEYNGELFSTIKAEIEKACPVLLKYVNGSDSTRYHWVVAYGYKDSCTSADDVYICDPSFTYDQLWGTWDVYWTAQYFTNKVYNTGITLTQASNDHSIGALRIIYKTSAK